ncbi:MAG: T9SS type A sorting domain-containing protein [Bacteroidota bacterium]
MKRFHAFKKTSCTVLIIRTCLFISLACPVQTAFTQTTNISGVVNTYHKVIEVIASKACLRVADATGLNVNTLVMVVQMKGATINTTSSSSSFGDTTSLNGSGNYEIGTICYIIGDSIFLFHNLLYSYDVSDKVQLVQFAEYYSANVTDTVKALSWDSTTGLGGVIAIFADQDITLTKPVWADSGGYSGGSYLLSSSTCSNAIPASNYAYTATSTSPQNGAYKGEGVATLATSQTGGRGAPANGGGGGNNHNNSGGGGANLTAGGIGGGNSSSLGCTTTLRGLGGKALGTWSGTKIFSGGGGGAGHSNNGLSSVHGGNGGGIVFIWANNLIGNNELISANGGSGGDSQSDGAGGGGAGGTIIMHVTNYTGNAIIRANGGNGGNSANGGTIGRCYGGAGGGSGGAVYFTGTVPPITITTNGGLAGVESGRDGTCAPAQAAGAGSSGQTISSYTFRRSTDPAGYCLLLLPSKLLYFKGQLINYTVALNWQVDHPELVRQFTIEKKTDNGWVFLVTVDAADNRFKYAAADPAPSPGNNFYRLRVTERNNDNYYSETRKVRAGTPPADFSLFPNPASGKVSVSGYFEPGSLLRLMDVSGRLVWQKTITGTNTAIILPGLSPGLYLVQCNGVTKKLIIR